MSEIANAEEIENNEEPPVPPEEPSEPTPPQATEFTENTYKEIQEAQASKNGWTPLKEWVESGHPPEKWVSAEVFNVKGEFIGQIKSQNKEFEERIANVNAVHEATMKAKIEELQAEKQELVLKGGEEAVRGVQAIDKQIAAINQPAVVQPQVDPAEQAWNEANPWIEDVDDPRSSYAKTQYGAFLQKGMDKASALKLVDQKIADRFPPRQPGGGAPPAEGGSRPGNKSSGPSIPVTMADLTADERKQVAAFPGWDEKKILSVVADMRKGK